MTITNEVVVETKLEDEFYIGEEGADDPLEESNGVAFQEFEEGTEVAKGSYVVPKEVAVEELKKYGGKFNCVTCFIQDQLVIALR